MASTALAEETRQFISAKQAAEQLGDGKAWSAVDPDGTKLKLTLAPDGTGSVRGPIPIPMSVTWGVEGDQLCLTTKMGKRCLRFTRISGGLQGWENNQLGMRFRR